MRDLFFSYEKDTKADKATFIKHTFKYGTSLILARQEIYEKVLKKIRKVYEIDSKLTS